MQWRSKCAVVIALATIAGTFPHSKAAPEGKALFENQPLLSEDAFATWYDVPPNSLAAERAPGELTAASDTLPLGAFVRITDETTSRNVIVRITDRGVHKRHTIDLCREAAEQIGLIGKGRMKVRLDILRPKSSAVKNSAKVTDR